MSPLGGRSRSITVPTAATLGPARYEVALDYICNPLQSWIWPIHVASPPINFVITPSEMTPLKSAGEDDGPALRKLLTTSSANYLHAYVRDANDQPIGYVACSKGG